MKKFSMSLLVFVLWGLTLPASASLIFDIIDNGGGPGGGDDDGVVGFIQFSTGGLITHTGNVVDFEYTNESGTIYTEADIISIRVLVDDLNSMLCWRAADTETVCENGFDISGAGDPYGILLTDATTGGYAWSVDSTAGANTANAFPTDTNFLDRFLLFAPQSANVPEPGTLVLIALGVAGMRYRRRQNKSA